MGVEGEDRNENLVLPLRLFALTLELTYSSDVNLEGHPRTQNGWNLSVFLWMSVPKTLLLDYTHVLYYTRSTGPSTHCVTNM